MQEIIIDLRSLYYYTGNKVSTSSDLIPFCSQFSPWWILIGFVGGIVGLVLGVLRASFILGTEVSINYAHELIFVSVTRAPLLPIRICHVPKFQFIITRNRKMIFHIDFLPSICTLSQFIHEILYLVCLFL
jgi:ABC-type lipoprotein release transport system permease subunit